MAIMPRKPYVTAKVFIIFFPPNHPVEELLGIYRRKHSKKISRGVSSEEVFSPSIERMASLTTFLSVCQGSSLMLFTDDGVSFENNNKSNDNVKYATSLYETPTHKHTAALSQELDGERAESRNHNIFPYQNMVAMKKHGT
eukprot:jgi/Bigna1/65570/fgenesh1_kg.116_\